MSNHQISLRGPTEKYPCSAQAQSIPGVPNSGVSIFLQRIFSAARKTVEGGRETLHFLCNNGFRVGMLEGNNLCICLRASFKEPACAVGVVFLVAIVAAVVIVVAVFAAPPAVFDHPADTAAAAAAEAALSTQTYTSLPTEGGSSWNVGNLP